MNLSPRLISLSVMLSGVATTYRVDGFKLTLTDPHVVLIATAAIFSIGAIISLIKKEKVHLIYPGIIAAFLLLGGILEGAFNDVIWSIEGTLSKASQGSYLTFKVLEKNFRGKRNLLEGAAQDSGLAIVQKVGEQQYLLNPEQPMKIRKALRGIDPTTGCWQMKVRIFADSSAWGELEGIQEIESQGSVEFCDSSGRPAKISQ